MTKKCKSCLQIKDVDCFYKNNFNLDGRENKCKLCRNVSSALNYADNKLRLEDVRKLWYKKNKDWYSKHTSEYRKNNREKRNQSANKRNKIREATDLSFKIKRRLRTRIWNALKGKLKSKRTMELVGCPIDKFREHIESLFVDGMTWENYGKMWHIDHIIPCSSFDLASSEHQRVCFHYSNLQPLWKHKNLSKSDSIPKITNISNSFKEMNERGWDRLYWLIDYHDTISPSKYSSEHGYEPDDFDNISMFPNAEKILKYLSDRSDMILILWSSMSDETATLLIDKLKSLYGISFDYFNLNPEVVSNSYACFNSKTYFNILLDNRAGFNPNRDWYLIEAEMIRIGMMQ